MALNGLYKSSKNIIEGVLRDTGIQEQINWEDCVSWIYEALGLIGSPFQYVNKVTGYQDNPDLDIVDFKAKLPCDLVQIKQIAVNGHPARYSSNTFHQMLDGSCCGFDIDSSGNSIDVFHDNFGNSFTPQAGLFYNQDYCCDYTFDLNHDYLTLSAKTGKVCLAYSAYPIDKEGYPEFPDDIKYELAIRKYLTMKMDYITWRSDPDSRGKQSLYEHSEIEWLWYVGSAGNSAKMPDLSRMESFKNQVLRLIPKTNEFSTFFKHLGTREHKRIH